MDPQHELDGSAAGDEMRRLAELHRLSLGLTQARGEQQVLDVILREAADGLGASGAVVWLRRDDALVLARGPAEDGGALPLDDEHPVARVARDGQPLYREAQALLPMLGGGGPVGVIVLAFPSGHALDAGERHLLVGFAGYAAHAIERARLHEQLSRGNRRLSAIVGQMRDGVSVTDARGQVVFVNDAGARLSGYPDAASMMQAAARGQLMIRFSFRDDAGRPIQATELLNRRILRGGPDGEQVLWYRNLDTAEERCSHLHAFAVRAEDGSVDLVVTVFRDITDERRGADALRFLDEASLELAESLDYQATLQAVARLAVPRLADWVAVDIVRPDGTHEHLVVEHRDPAKLELVRRLQERFPPDPDAPTGVPHVVRTGQPELYPEIPLEVLEHVVGDDEPRRLILELGLRSGMVVPIRHRGAVLGAISFATAESNRRYTQADLTIAMELARRAAVAIENARLYADARAAVQLRDDFLSVAGHELRTPLTALTLQLDRVHRQVHKEAGTAELLPQVQRALGQVERIGRLVGDLLDVARLNSGRLELDLDQTDLCSLAREVVERFADQAQRVGCALEVTVPATCVGSWDRTRLDQVMTNLLSNALKYGAGKPVELEVTCTDERARVRVVDHGIGISDHDRVRIFERFERAVSDRHFGGLGLGLWISREIVRAHGGTIEVTSQPAVETVFSVELPRVAG